ncbi:Protein kinase C-binding protein NELL1 [Cricetulus griseus]|uniref:Protein kinase C-binding protein NELL1 n=1 Tax=Cricetulus griseus TaxID=10029 RepID=G3IAK9_CRIGR|nr:Protein kinase C-binding protein NELL1 [Cricetulus griseus]
MQRSCYGNLVVLSVAKGRSGAVECRKMSCPPLNCSPDSLPVHISGQCCKVCRPKCIYGGKVLAEGQRILNKSCRECRGGVLVKITEACPPLNCSAEDHILPENQCCKVCRGHNFCAEAPKCGENSECKNWNTKATCECKNGYISVQGNSAYCEGKGPVERPCGEVAEKYGFSSRSGVSYVRAPVLKLYPGSFT